MGLFSHLLFCLIVRFENELSSANCYDGNGLNRVGVMTVIMPAALVTIISDDKNYIAACCDKARFSSLLGTLKP